MSIKEKVTNATENAKNNLKTILLDVAVVVVSIAYVLSTSLVLKPPEEEIEPLTITIRVVVSIIVGLVIKMALGENGFTKGYKTTEWINQKKSYSEKCEQALPYIDQVDEFYDSQRKKKLKNIRKTRLSGAMLKYATFFDDDGNYKEEVKTMSKSAYNRLKKHNPDYKKPSDVILLDYHQRKVLRRCVRTKVYIRNLFNQYETDQSYYEHKERTDKDQRSKNMTRNTASAIALSLAGVYYIPTFIFNWATIILALLQVAVWVTFGIVQLYSNFNFVKFERTEQLKTKENDIATFIIESKGREKFIEENCKKVDPISTPEVDFIEVTEEQLKALQNK